MKTITAIIVTAIIIIYFASLEYDGVEKVMYQPDSFNAKFAINEIANYATVKKQWVCHIKLTYENYSRDTAIAVFGKKPPECRFYPAFETYCPIRDSVWYCPGTLEVLWGDHYPRYHTFIPKLTDYDFSYYKL